MDRVAATCTKCDVPVVVEDENDDTARVSCPECGQDFGSWGDVKSTMTAKAEEALKDELRESVKDHPWITVR